MTDFHSEDFKQVIDLNIIYEDLGLQLDKAIQIIEDNPKDRVIIVDGEDPEVVMISYEHWLEMIQPRYVKGE